MSQFNHVVLHLLIYGDVGVEVDVDDDVDAGVISHVILSAAQAADRRVLMVSPQNAADLTRPVVLINATMTKGRVLIFSLHFR